MEKKRLKGVLKSLLFLGFYTAMITGYAIKSCIDKRGAESSPLEKTIEKEPISSTYVSGEKYHR